MRRFQLVLGALSALFLVSTASAAPQRVSWSLGVGVGAPIYRPHGYHPWDYCPWDYYYRPYPVYVSPPPFYIEPAPVIYQQPVQMIVPSAFSPTPVVTPAYSSPTPTVIRASGETDRAVSIQHWQQQLRQPNENLRHDAAMELGRLRADTALDSLAVTLAGDGSPVVRDAAAKALGLIGSTRALTALGHAAQADADRDVRRSAQYAIEVIRANVRP